MSAAINKEAASNAGKTLRILVIAPTPFFADRGCHVRILEQAKALTNRGHEVLICTYHLGRNIEGLSIERTLKIPWYNKLSAGPSIHKLYMDLLLTYKAIGSARSWKPDIIHAHLHEGVMVGGWLKRFWPAPLVFDAQGSLTGEVRAHRWLKSRRLIPRLLLATERSLNNKADMVLVSQAATGELFRDRFSVPGEKITVLEDGVDVDLFSPRLASPELRSSLGIGEKDIVIAYLGVLTDYQGVDDLLAAAPLVIRKHQSVKLLLMGYPNVERYRQMAADLGIADHVIFTGRIDYLNQAPEYLSLADIAVSPKKDSSEGNGKLFNYMAMGMPIVAYDTDVSRAILGDSALLVPVGKRDMLAESLIRLIESPADRAELSRRARRRVVETHSWNQRIGVLEDVYRQLLSRERAYGGDAAQAV